MDKFNHTHKGCSERVEIKQTELLPICRLGIYNTVLAAIDNSINEIEIKLDTRLYNIHRKTLISELLIRFTTLTLIRDTATEQEHGNRIEKNISEEDEIIDDVTGIRIIIPI